MYVRVEIGELLRPWEIQIDLRASVQYDMKQQYFLGTIDVSGSDRAGLLGPF